MRHARLVSPQPDGSPASARPRFAYLDAPTPLAFAHRGAAPDGLENTMAAFERAIRSGYRYLETDVRVTRDGVPVLFHDATLDRVTDSSGRLAARRFAELSSVRVAGLEPVPRLEDVLGTWPEVRLNLDVKITAAVEPLVTAIRRTGSLDRVCIGAFSDARLARIRAALGPRLCTSLGPRAALALWRASRWGWASRSGPDHHPDRRGYRFRSGHPSGWASGSGPPDPSEWASGSRPADPSGQASDSGPLDSAGWASRSGPADPSGRAACRIPSVDRRFIVAAHRRGLPVHVWTINRPSQMRRLLDLGVDGIMTDRADLLRDLLVQRGQWPGSRAA